MNRFSIIAIAIAALLLAGVMPAADVAESNNPGSPQPLLGCSDVNGDGPVAVGDIGAVVARFGSVAGQANYWPLYDLSEANGNVNVGDIAIVLSDFGLNCLDVSPVDTQIARATLAIGDPNFDSQQYCGVPRIADAGFFIQNDAFLATKGYYRGSTDVPGQGVHYVHGENFADDLFNPCRPEGLVYDNGKLVAQLYYVDGYAVGWGGEPPPEDQVEIDAFCSPMPPTTSCSWAGGEDGWHWHFDLCTIHIGTPQAAAIPGAFVGGFGSPRACGEFAGGNEPQCTSPATTYPCWRWSERVGWMGHMWNWVQVNPNGRFADCSPDGAGWKGFNCPQ